MHEYHFLHNLDMDSVIYFAISTLQDALNVSHVTEPLSSCYQKASFIINPPVLEEIIYFGLESPNKNVCNYTVSLINAWDIACAQSFCGLEK